MMYTTFIMKSLRKSEMTNDDIIEKIPEFNVGIAWKRKTSKSGNLTDCQEIKTIKKRKVDREKKFLSVFSYTGSTSHLDVFAPLPAFIVRAHLYTSAGDAIHAGNKSKNGNKWLQSEAMICASIPEYFCSSPFACVCVCVCAQIKAR